MNHQTITTTICIIGAGPAGATTSLFLTKKKIKHLLVDAAVFPRDKICGDGLDLKVVRVLNQSDPSIFKDEMVNDPNFSQSLGATVIVSKDKKLTIGLDKPMNDYPYFMVCKRAYFDNFLASKISSPYADFMQGTRIISLVKQDDKWIINAVRDDQSLTIMADFIVGADGDHSIVLKSLGQRKINREHYIAGLRQYWSGVSEIDSSRKNLEVYLPKTLPMAYLWIFPLANGEANVGCGMTSYLIKKRNVDLKKLFHQIITEDPEIAHRFKNATPLETPKGWGLPLASEKRKVFGDNYLLVGDAAGMICPTTGEGIGPGMTSGYIAANFIEKAIKEKSFHSSVFKNYDREIFKRLQDDIIKFNILRKLPPTAYNQLVKVLCSLGISNYYFDKNIKKWITTASSVPIEVKF